MCAALKPGVQISWRGRAYHPEKEGVVVAVVPPGEDIQTTLTKALLDSGRTTLRSGEKFAFQAANSSRERYLVRVDREGLAPIWYAPETSTVDREQVDPHVLIAAIRARGGRANDLRDGAHEACHALSLDLPVWNPLSINTALERLSGTQRLQEEILARAVEQLVCKKARVDVGPIEGFATITLFEAIHAGLSFPNQPVLVRLIREAMDSFAARAMAHRVLALRVELCPT